MSKFFVLFHLFFFVLLSCSGGNVQTANPTISNTERPDPRLDSRPPAEPPEIKRRTTKIPDPVKQEKCSAVDRNACGDNEKCEDICNDIFRNRRDKRKCYAYPEDLVYDFDQILEDVEDGEVENIDPEALDCMLDLDETQFARSVQKMSNRESKEFLFAIVQDDDLAEVFKSEDDEFNILDQLLHKATKSDDIKKQLGVEIDDDKNFLWLAAEYNEYAWEWLDDYVGDYCENENRCPGGENISIYCSVLLDTRYFKRRKLEDFLSDADYFAEEYEDDVEDDEYMYAVDSSPGDRYEGDFTDWCTVQTTVNAPCPENGTEPSVGKLATITFAGTTTKEYQESYCHRKPGVTATGGRHRSVTLGSDTPSQDIILYLSDYPELFLNTDAITGWDDNTGKTYYLYIDDDRYELTIESGNSYSYNNNACSGLPSKTIQGFGGTEGLSKTGTDALDGFSTATNYDVYLAYEKDGVCTYISP